jgi:putative endonuclease
MTSRAQKGKCGESIAVAFLREKGLEILDQNVRSPLGEIDVVARHGPTVVFVEVKSKHTARFGLPQEAVTPMKQKRLTRLAQWYLKRHRLEGQSARFDVVAVSWHGTTPQIEWIANAFEAWRE